MSKLSKILIGTAFVGAMFVFMFRNMTIPPMPWMLVYKLSIACSVFYFAIGCIAFEVWKK